MNELVPRDIDCPYCGEVIEILLDPSVDQQHYVEDCQVCCRPIEIRVTVDHEGDLMVSVAHEND